MTRRMRATCLSSGRLSKVERYHSIVRLLTASEWASSCFSGSSMITRWGVVHVSRQSSQVLRAIQNVRYPPRRLDLRQSGGGEHRSKNNPERERIAQLGVQVTDDRL